MELISIVVPVYKVEQYLDDCIQSIVNQTYKNLEIILVDDGSPDRSSEICDEWAARDSRIRVIHQPYKGVSAARNVGLDLVQGDYIGFVDSDDYIAEDMYEQLLSALKGSDKGISCCLISRVYDDGRIVSDKITQKGNVDLSIEQAIKGNFYQSICNAVWCKLYKKEVLENIRFPVGEVNEDYPVIIPIIKNSNGMVLVNKTLYFYRKRAGSITSFGYATSSNARFMHNNLLFIGKQLKENNLNCKKSYLFFIARNAYSMALVMEKNINVLNDETKDLLKKYKKLMRRGLFAYVFSKYSTLKDKALYLMVLTKTLRPMYKILNKSL